MDTFGVENVNIITNRKSIWIQKSLNFIINGLQKCNFIVRTIFTTGHAGIVLCYAIVRRVSIVFQSAMLC